MNLQITKRTNTSRNLVYEARYEGNPMVVGEVVLTQTQDAALALLVHPDHRRKGIATALYDFIETDLGKPLDAAPNRSTPEQKEFRASWEKHRTEK